MSEALWGRVREDVAVGEVYRGHLGRTAVDSPWTVDPTTEEVET
jgi:hypothetical protein